MNTQEIYPLILKSYMDSELATAVIYQENVEVNASFKKLFFSLPDELPSFLSDLAEENGLQHKFLNGNIYTTNVVKIADITVIEFIKTEDMQDIVANPAVRKYLMYVFSKLRLSVSSISAAANDIHAILAQNEASDKYITNNLLHIDSSLLKIIGLLIDPEQFVYLASDVDEAESISTADEITRICKDMKSVFDRHAHIVCAKNDIMFARLNRTALRTLLVDTTAQFKQHGYIPDEIIVSSESIGDKTARITIESNCRSKRSYAEYCQLRNINTEDPMENFFFEYICSAFCKRYNASFEQHSITDGHKFIFTFPIIANSGLAVNAPNLFNPGIGKFDVVNARFSEFKE